MPYFSVSIFAIFGILGGPPEKGVFLGGGGGGGVGGGIFAIFLTFDTKFPKNAGNHPYFAKSVSKVNFPGNFLFR